MSNNKDNPKTSPNETVEKEKTDIGNQEIPKEIDEDLDNILEALFFASDEALSLKKIRIVLQCNLNSKRLRKSINSINTKLQRQKKPFEIAELAGGFQFRTIQKYHSFLKGLFKEKSARRLSSQALETLAIIAYKQPVSRSEIEDIRSVSTDGAIKTLLEKRLIEMLGKSEEKPGKPLVYGTSREFLKYFGLTKISDLPKMEEIEEISMESNKMDLIADHGDNIQKQLDVKERANTTIANLNTNIEVKEKDKTKSEFVEESKPDSKEEIKKESNENAQIDSNNTEENNEQELNKNPNLDNNTQTIKDETPTSENDVEDSNNNTHTE